MRFNYHGDHRLSMYFGRLCWIIHCGLDAILSLKCSLMKVTQRLTFVKIQNIKTAFANLFILLLPRFRGFQLGLASYQLWQILLSACTKPVQNFNYDVVSIFRLNLLQTNQVFCFTKAKMTLINPLLRTIYHHQSLIHAWFQQF